MVVFPHAIADAINDFEASAGVRVWQVIGRPGSWRAEYSDLHPPRRPQPREPQATGPERLSSFGVSGPLAPLMETLQGIAAKAGTINLHIARPARDAAPLLIWWTARDPRTALRTPVLHHARIECDFRTRNSGSPAS